MTLEIIIPSFNGGHEMTAHSLEATATQGKWHTIIDSGLEGWLPKVQDTYEMSNADILAYFHADVIVNEIGWDERVLRLFKDESVGLVGFGGAKALGHPDIYKLPYRLEQLARRDFYSNLKDAESHGTREAGVTEVVTLDSFALIVRREVLRRAGGWPMHYPPSTHCLDHWLALTARKLGYRVMMLGVACSHASGGVSLGGADYPAWAAKTKWGSDHAMHAESHRLLYDEFRGILPVEVE